MHRLQRAFAVVGEQFQGVDDFGVGGVTERQHVAGPEQAGVDGLGEMAVDGGGLEVAGGSDGFGVLALQVQLQGGVDGVAEIVVQQRGQRVIGDLGQEGLAVALQFLFTHAGQFQ